MSPTPSTRPRRAPTAAAAPLPDPEHDGRPALAAAEPVVDERLPAVTVYVVSAPHVAIDQRGGLTPGLGAVAMQQMFTRGAVLPAWVTPEQIEHLLRQGLVEAIGRHGGATRPQAAAPPAEQVAPPVWEPATRYRVVWPAVVIPDPTPGLVSRQDPYYQGQTLPRDVDRDTVDRLLAQGAIEPKRRPA